MGQFNFELSKTQSEIYELLSNKTGKEVIDTIINYWGIDEILETDFAKHLIDEELANETDFTEL